jgi:ABC-2 type transport system ATP-binding protein
METTTVLETIDLTKRYETGVLAVDQLNLQVHAGEIYVLLGANGAGKTTTMMLMFGFTEPTEGTAKICGIDVTRDPLSAKKHAAYVSENVMLYGNFTAMQNIEFFAKLGGASQAAIAQCEQILLRVGLSKDAHRQRVRGFSKGMRQRLGIAIAMIKNSEVIILDEPTSGLDPKGGADFLDILRELKAEGKAIFMSSHDIFRAEIVADRVGIMSHGRIVQELDRANMAHQNLETLYLKYELEK